MLTAPSQVQPAFSQKRRADAFWNELWALSPKLVSFAISFTVAIFWVNHHHFMHRVDETDWPLLWLNNLLLFWLGTVPFTTGFLGDYPREPVPVAVGVYAFSLGMAALAIIVIIPFALRRAEPARKRGEGSLPDD